MIVSDDVFYLNFNFVSFYQFLSGLKPPSWSDFDLVINRENNEYVEHLNGSDTDFGFKFNRKRKVKLNFFKETNNETFHTRTKMPTIILDRIPLPNLKVYTSVSVLLVSFCVYFAIDSTKDPDWRLLLNSTSSDDDVGFVDSKLMDDESLIKLTDSEMQSELSDVIDRNVYMNILSDTTPVHGNQTRSLGGQLKDVMDFMFQEPVCVWVSWIVLIFFSIIKNVRTLVIDDFLEVEIVFRGAL